MYFVEKKKFKNNEKEKNNIKIDAGLSFNARQINNITYFYLFQQIDGKTCAASDVYGLIRKNI